MLSVEHSGFCLIMTRAALFVLFAFLSSWASADAPVDGWRIAILGQPYKWFATADDACQSRKHSANSVSTVPDASEPFFRCRIVRLSDNYTEYLALWKQSSMVCPDGTAPDMTKPEAQRCPSPPPPPPQQCAFPVGTPVTFGQWEGWGSLTSNVPETGKRPYPTASTYCNLEGIPEIKECYSIVMEGKKRYYCVYTGISSGTVSDGDYNANGAPTGPPPEGTQSPERVPMPPKTAPEKTGQCPRGSIMAGYNGEGTPMCVGTGTAPPVPSTPPPTKTTTNTVSNPDGSTTTTTTNTQTNRDGSTSTTTTVVTKAPDGSTSTSGGTVVTPTPSGAPGRTDSPAEQQNFCKQNPTLSVCRESSVAGKCGEISCLGDAIQCATLRAAAAMQCQQQKDIDELSASPHKALGEQILSGSDPLADQFGAAIKGTEVDLSKPNLDQAGFLGAGSCFPNKTFTVVGRNVTVDFTDVCKNIQPIRYAVLACAFIAAYLIVSRSVLAS